MLGVFFILIGFFMIFTGLFSSGKVMEVWGGGLVIIGPIPIIFRGELGSFAISLIIMATIIAFLLPLLYLLRFRNKRIKKEG